MSCPCLQTIHLVPTITHVHLNPGQRMSMPNGVGKTPEQPQSLQSSVPTAYQLAGREVAPQV